MKKIVAPIAGIIFMTSLAITAVAQTAPNTASTNNPAVPITVTPQNYKEINVQASDLPQSFKVKPHKVLVIEFFSYGCPWCKALDPDLNTWVDHKPANVNFKRIPVAFEQGWEAYQKAFYTSEKLGVEKKLHDTLFSVAQNPFTGLNSDEQVKSFFINNQVDNLAYDQAAKDPSITKNIADGAQLMSAFKIISIPTVIITDGKKFYLISNDLVAANNQLYIATLQYVIHHNFSALSS